MVAFLLLPILTRYLSPHDCGIVKTLTALIAIYLLWHCPLRREYNFAKKYFNHAPSERATLIGRMLTLTCLNTLVLGLADGVSAPVDISHPGDVSGYM